MKVFSIKQEGLAHLSYFITSKHKAIVIDPRRDADVYLDLSRQTRSKIELILESHRNEDYVIGSLELQHLVPEAKICHSQQTAFQYGDMNLADGEVLQIGGMEITCLNTPGHTNDSMCYVLADRSVSEDPILCFTGDTLFVGNVGRTDLVDPKLTEKNAIRLYQSIHEKLMKLEDGVIIYPGHGAGSVCGGEMAEREFSTIGYERRNNQWLQLDEVAFAEKAKSQDLVLAAYFKHCERLNTIGPPLVSDIVPPPRLTSEEFEELAQQPDRIIVDTRPHDAFATMHIPKSISLSLSIFGLVVGWVVNPDEKVLLVMDREEDLDSVFRYLVRVGLDNVIGYLGDTMAGWTSSGRPIGSLRIIGPKELQQALQSRELSVIDVRENTESRHDPVEGAEPMPLTSIRQGNITIRNRPLVTLCPVGVRATTGASLLQRAGFDNVYISIGGIKAFQRILKDSKNQS